MAVALIVRPDCRGKVAPAAEVLSGMPEVAAQPVASPDCVRVEATEALMIALPIRLGSAYRVTPESAWSPELLAA